MRTAVFALMTLLPLAAEEPNFNDLTVEKLAAGHEFTEGPVWSREGFLLYSDVPANKIFKIGPDGKSVFKEKTNGANGNTYDAQGRLYTCESRTRRVIRTDKKGNVEVIADKFEGKKLNAPNDIVVRKDGHIYFTDPAFGNQAEGRELDFFGVYHIPPKGPIELVVKPTGRPNGIAFSPDGKVLYVANSDDRNVRAYDVDKAGKATNERVVISGTEGVPDGIRVDEKGNIYVTCKGVAIYSPQGKLLRMIELSETPANVAFGEGDFQTMFITARTSVYRVRMPVKGSVQY